MRIRLKGINSLTKKLADGTVKTYWYAWKGGPRIDAEPGTPEFIRLYSEAVAGKAKKSTETFISLIDYFKDQSEYTGLGDKSKRAYDQYLTLIEAKFGTMPIGAIEDKRARGTSKHSATLSLPRHGKQTTSGRRSRACSRSQRTMARSL